MEDWSRVRALLRADVGEAAFRSWLKPLTFAGSRDEIVRLAVPTRFMRDWIQSNYADQILKLWREAPELPEQPYLYGTLRIGADDWVG